MLHVFSSAISYLYPQRRNVISSMVGFKNCHIRKNLTNYSLFSSGFFVFEGRGAGKSFGLVWVFFCLFVSLLVFCFCFCFFFWGGGGGGVDGIETTFI